ncbi:MAG: thioredoxin family protein [Deltaproteobacteria bacterium]|nr:thioredoxin family protein [Deltaproteobacteria bacterium]
MATESKPIELGVSCANFNLPGVDGKNHSLNDYQSSKVLVIAFTCNHCPYVQAYESRLNDLAQNYKSKGVSFVAINANDSQSHPDDSFPKMKERAKTLNFHFDYLHDESQAVAKSFNAACTPEFYVYDQQRKLRYHGRLDDNQKDIASVKKTYLKDAIEDLLVGKDPRETQTSAIGCSIKWK